MLPIRQNDNITNSRIKHKLNVYKEGHKHCSYGQLVRNINLFNSKRVLTTPAKKRRWSDSIGERGLVLQTPLHY